MHMKAIIFYVTRYEKHFMAVMEKRLRMSSEETIRGYKTQLAQAERCLAELDRMFSASMRTMCPGASPMNTLPL